MLEAYSFTDNQFRVTIPPSTIQFQKDGGTKMGTVGIIGRGKYGQFLERLFIEFGTEVISSDIKDGPNVKVRNQSVVDRSDVVIFSVPPRETVAVIESLISYSRPDQLWMDVTSIKTPS